MDRTDHPLETMESSNGRWVVAPDPRTGLFWRTTPVRECVIDIEAPLDHLGNTVRRLSLALA